MSERRIIPLDPVPQSPLPDSGRRSFLGALLAMATAGVGAVLSVPLVRLGLHPILGKAGGTAWSDVGAVADFASATAPVKVLITVEQRDGWRRISSTKPVYVVRHADGRVRVLSAVCPHLGCTVSWNDERTQFVSPCHNGVFAPDGSFISGPPPRGMDELDSMVDGDRLKVRYQYFRQLVPTREVIA